MSRLMSNPNLLSDNPKLKKKSLLPVSLLPNYPQKYVSVFVPSHYIIMYHTGSKRWDTFVCCNTVFILISIWADSFFINSIPRTR